MLHVEASIPSETTLEKVVDEDLNEFDGFFVKRLGNSRMTPSERAIVKTYLYFKLRKKDEG